MPTSISLSGSARSPVSVHLEWDAEGLEALVAESFRQSMEEWGPLVEDFARQLAPVDTGLLKDSITHVVRDDGDRVELVLSADARNEQGLNYALFQEMGTSRTAAQPYLQPAMEAHYQAIMEGAAIIYKRNSTFFGRLKRAARRFFRF